MATLEPCREDDHEWSTWSLLNPWRPTRTQCQKCGEERSLSWLAIFRGEKIAEQAAEIERLRRGFMPCADCSAEPTCEFAWDRYNLGEETTTCLGSK